MFSLKQPASWVREKSPPLHSPPAWCEVIFNNLRNLSVILSVLAKTREKRKYILNGMLLWTSHPWKCSRTRMGLWAIWSSEMCPCPLEGNWNWMIFKVPFNLNYFIFHSVTQALFYSPFSNSCCLKQKALSQYGHAMEKLVLTWVEVGNTFPFFSSFKTVLFLWKWAWDNNKKGNKSQLIWQNTSPLPWEVGCTSPAGGVTSGRWDSQFTGRTAWFKPVDSWLRNTNELLQGNMLLHIGSFTAAVWVRVYSSQQVWDHWRHLSSPSWLRTIQGDAVSGSVVS